MTSEKLRKIDVFPVFQFRIPSVENTIQLLKDCSHGTLELGSCSDPLNQAKPPGLSFILSVDGLKRKIRVFDVKVLGLKT